MINMHIITKRNSSICHEEKLIYLFVTGFASMNRQIKEDDLFMCRFFTFIVVENCDVTLEANLLMPNTKAKMLASETQNLIG